MINVIWEFDPYTLAVARHSQYLLPDTFKARVYRTQGWIAPVVLVDGRIVGVWSHEKQRGQVTVKLEMFVEPAAAVEQGITAEVQRLGEFLGMEARETTS